MPHPLPTPMTDAQHRALIQGESEHLKRRADAAEDIADKTAKAKAAQRGVVN
jgi:hypothetical protein